MGYRFSVILCIMCLALGGLSCASQPQEAHPKVTKRKEIVMPLQTGSTLHRRIIVADEYVTTAKPSKKNKDKKEPKKHESRRKSPKPTPTPEKAKQSEEEPLPLPDRFR